MSIHPTEPTNIIDPSTLPGKALQIAITQLGIQEEPRGSNWGPHIQKYLASVGITVPAPWCAAFVYWCFDQAARALGVKNTVFRTGRVLLLWEMCKAKYSVVTPQPGDVGILIFKDGTGHAFIVRRVHPDHVDTVEGNSNDEGSREGFEVCEKPGGRQRAAVRGFLRFT